MDLKSVAPCGMDCDICMAYLREKNKCPGCREPDKNKCKSCRLCIIKNCSVLKKSKQKFCSAKCEKYPCKRLKDLDKRYRTKYGMSMIENLENIKKIGIRKFVINERIRWKCAECGGIINVHRWCCFNCGKKRID